jgi:hypothetical protein
MSGIIVGKCQALILTSGAIQGQPGPLCETCRERRATAWHRLIGLVPGKKVQRIWWVECEVCGAGKNQKESVE